MIIGKAITERVTALLSEGTSLEDVLYTVVRENLKHLPEHLKDDPEEVSTVLRAVQYYATEVHPEFGSGVQLHDLTLKRLIPKQKTERYISRLEEEV